MRMILLVRSLLLAVLVLALPVKSSAAIIFSVTIAPPPLPVYEQPLCPGEGYIWTPGYWAYGDFGYFWVPGTWVLVPEPGLLWTPGYWGWGDGVYIFHEGYWGPHVDVRVHPQDPTLVAKAIKPDYGLSSHVAALGLAFSDVTSVMDFGIVIGAAAAATLAGRFAPSLRAGIRSLAAALIGGLLLGYGARIGYGCNIGAFFSGIASGSVHGWIWFPSALAGNFAGAKLRPFFGLRL